MSDVQDDPATSSEVAAPRKKKMVKRKPARKQVGLAFVEVGQVEKRQPEQTGSTWNVWYHKWAGGDKYDSYNVKEKSQTRVDIGKDAGYTRADGGNNAYLCLFFARGCCPYGHECTYLHRLPPPAHVLPDSSLDVFGREKHADYRDDMGGVGSFSRMNRTLYIGRIKENRNTAEMIERHFEEFGEIERIKILTNRGVAFVTYVSELNAQFAKEAMMHQSLDEEEVVNVRWATEDPNPTAKVAEHKYLVKKGEEGMAKALDPEFVQHVREMDELEGLVEPRTLKFDKDSEDYAGDVRVAKRARIEAPVGGEATTSAAAAPPLPVEEAPTAPMGILSANALDSLKYMASLRQAAPAAAAPKPAPAKAIGGLGGLADYGSDDDE
ncbi:pre-mRNA splicing factor CWC2 [Pseudohyphozyma bogoriensis]|nr:pre-mRNA splicing factor CWC2 [Pseudohyphozyma bogoriensis]